MGYRLGIDVGGTLTDLVLFSEESGALVVGKVPSVPADPSQGIIDGIIKTLAAAARFSRAHLGLWKQTMGLAPAVPPPVNPMQRAYLSWQPEGAYQNPRRLRTSAFREAGREVGLPPRHRGPVWAEGEMI